VDNQAGDRLAREENMVARYQTGLQREAFSAVQRQPGDDAQARARSRRESPPQDREIRRRELIKTPPDEVAGRAVPSGNFAPVA
jgi:hypothetical protein